MEASPSEEGYNISLQPSIVESEQVPTDKKKSTYRRRTTGSNEDLIPRRYKNDIVCGRGTGYNIHGPNVQLLKWIQRRLPRYIQAQIENEKHVVKSVIGEVHSLIKCNVVKRQNTGSGDSWSVLSKGQVRTAIGYKFRQRKRNNPQLVAQIKKQLLCDNHDDTNALCKQRKKEERDKKMKKQDKDPKHVVRVRRHKSRKPQLSKAANKSVKGTRIRQKKSNKWKSLMKATTTVRTLVRNQKRAHFMESKRAAETLPSDHMSSLPVNESPDFTTKGMNDHTPCLSLSDSLIFTTNGSHPLDTHDEDMKLASDSCRYAAPAHSTSTDMEVDLGVKHNNFATVMEVDYMSVGLLELQDDLIVFPDA